MLQLKNSPAFYKKITLSAIIVLATALFLHFIVPEQIAVWEDQVYAKTVLHAGLLLLLAAGVVAIALWSIWRNPVKQDRTPAFVLPLVSGGLALLLITLGYIVVGMWPMGEESAMIVDMHHQYAPMLAHLRDMFLHGGNVLYSFEAGMGVSFLSMFGYYLASPLNFLLVFFPERLLDVGILFITVLKVALSATLFACMLQYLHRRRNIAVIAVSLMYALMLYMLAYSWNLMWLDVVALLPLVVMCFERMMRTGKMVAYIVTLALLLFCNYYIGFMVCIFLVLYFIAYLLRTRRNALQNATSSLRFIVGSALGGGLVMCLLIPVYFALTTTSAAGGTLPDTAANFSLFDLLGRHLYGITPTIRSGNLPNIACGLLAVVMLPLFATNKGISVRRRISFVGLWLVLAFSLVINRFDLLWHGLHAPNDLPYRFSFLYSFVLLLIAYETLVHIRHIRLPQIVATGAGLIAYLMIEEKFGTQGYDFKAVYVSLLLIFLYCLFTALASRRVLRARMAYALLFVVVCAELLLGTGKTLVQLNSQEYYTDHDLYVDNMRTEVIDKTIRMTQAIAERDLGKNTFYRMELLPRRTLVDPSLFDYRGLTLFSSSNYYETTRLMNALGYASNGVNSYMYHSFVAPVDSMLGMRYLVFNNVLTGNKYLNLLDSYSQTDETTGETLTYYIYENKNALPIAFLAQNPVKNWEYSYYDPYYTQNSLFSAMTGLQGNLYSLAPLRLSNGSSNGSVNSSVSPSYITLSADSGTARFTADIEQDGHYFIYVDCRAARSVSAVVVSGSTSTHSITPYEPFLIDAGALSAGDYVQISMTTSVSCAGNIYVMRLNEEYFEQAVEKLQSGGLQVTEFSNSKIVGTVNAAHKGVMMTSIPYDRGWSVYVDGKEVPSYAISNALLAFDISEGAHTVELRYWPSGLTVGLIVSVLSLALLILLIFYTRRHPPQDVTAELPTDGDDDDDGDCALAITPEAPTFTAADFSLDISEQDAPIAEEPAAEAEDDFLTSFYIQDGKGMKQE